MEWLRSHALALPLLVKLALGLGIVVVVRPLYRRLSLPAVLGLLLLGALVGPYGPEIREHTRPIAAFFGTLGKRLISTAGLEIDFALLRSIQ